MREYRSETNRLGDSQVSADLKAVAKTKKQKSYLLMI
jgi:hypothetical protein